MGAVPQLREVLVQVVELVHREIAQCALPALPGVRAVDGGVTSYGVHLAAQLPRLRDQRVDRAAPGRLRGGAVRGEMGRHDALR